MIIGPSIKARTREEAARADIVFVERRPAPGAERLRKEILRQVRASEHYRRYRHNLPPEAPQAFAEAVIDVAKF